MRNRVFTIGSLKGMNLAGLEGKLRNVSAYPVHHAFAFFKSTETNENTDPMEVDPEKQASYAASFKNAYDKAVQAKRLDKNQPVPDVSDRFSAKNVAQPFMTSASPWTKSQLDVCLGLTRLLCVSVLESAQNPVVRYDLIIKANVDPAPFGSRFCPLADVSQTCGRGAVHCNGTLPTLCTSSRLFFFGNPPRSLSGIWCFSFAWKVQLEP